MPLPRHSQLRSLSRQSKQSSEEFIPFSWSLFVLAVLQFSVWSLGVYEAHAREFYNAHTTLVKTCSSDKEIELVKSVETLVQQYQESVQRQIEERERELLALKQKQSLALESSIKSLSSSNNHLIERLFTTILLFTIGSAGTSESSKAGNQANTAILC